LHTSGIEDSFKNAFGASGVTIVPDVEGVVIEALGDSDIESKVCSAPDVLLFLFCSQEQNNSNAETAIAIAEKRFLITSTSFLLKYFCFNFKRSRRLLH